VNRIARGALLVLAAAWCTQSCKSPADAFECHSESECDAATSSGTCYQGACYYPDDKCPDEWRSRGECTSAPGTDGSGGASSGGSGGSGGGSSGSSGSGNGGGSGSGNGGSGGSGTGGEGSGSISGSGGIAGSGGVAGNGGSGGIAGNGGIGNGGSNTGGTGGTAVEGDLAVLAGKIGGIGTVDGTGDLARFATPGCLAFDGGHYLYMGDMYAETIRRIDTNTGAVTTIAGFPYASGSTDGHGEEARFYRPECVAYDGTDTQDPVLYVSEWQGARIRRIALKDNAVTLLAGSTENGVGYVDASGENARFEGPEAMARRGNFLYVTDFYNHALRAINLTTKAVTTVIGDPVNKESGTTDGPIATARLQRPHALAFDSTGNKLFIGEHYPGERVRVLDFTNNTVSTLITGVGAVQAMAYDSPNNRLVVTLFEDQKVVSVNIATKTSSLLAGSGAIDEIDGPPATAAFHSPSGVAVGPSGTVFVADFDGPTLRKLVANGSGAYQTTTFAGRAARKGHGDAIGEAARFDQPGDMALAPDNRTLYVVDTDDNCAIRTVDTGTKQVGTLAGGGKCERKDGTGVAATFNFPGAMTMGTGTGGGAPPLFVTEAHGVVRKVDTANGAVSTLFTGDDARPVWRGIAATASTIYVTAEFERKVFQLPIGGGTLNDYAGTGGEGCDDSASAISTFGRLGGIVWDGATSLYVADQACQTIRRINLTAHTVQTVAGGNAEGDENPDGVGRNAAFFYPGSLTWDRQKKGIYVQDMHLVRWVSATTFEVKTVAGAPGAQGGVWISPNPPHLNFPGGMIEGTAGELYLSSEGAILKWKKTTP
jgi:hypothetical protein